MDYIDYMLFCVKCSRSRTKKMFPHIFSYCFPKLSNELCVTVYLTFFTCVPGKLYKCVYTSWAMTMTCSK